MMPFLTTLILHQGMMPLNWLSPLFVELVTACGLEGLFRESELRLLSQSAGLQGLIPDRDLSIEGGNEETRRRPRKWCSWSHDKGCQPRWFFPAKREGFEAGLGPFPHGICKEDWRVAVPSLLDLSLILELSHSVRELCNSP